ncbi:hypothetical protein GWK47_054467 [Chionoecetes opilio]|uniref:Endonuclease/exonuclease/phosphatase domain-containing protein n=1 Tax=Chionoecetes opilio TaxID=41210 RepID=A0A8J4Y703_CHIOP|nr:hypothetical protein GWK47_054467 [Chionoecetes opilio]
MRLAVRLAVLNFDVFNTARLVLGRSNHSRFLSHCPQLPSLSHASVLDLASLREDAIALRSVARLAELWARALTSPGPTATEGTNSTRFSNKMGKELESWCSKKQRNKLLEQSMFLFPIPPGRPTQQELNRSTQGGGVALCYRETVNVQVVETPVHVPRDLELLTLKIIDSDGQGLLCVGCYRPPSQGTALLDFLTVNLDSMMTANQCDRVLIIGDLNQHIVRDDFSTLHVVNDLQNHVHFPTHISGSSLDPVVTDLPPHTVQCQPLDFVSTSDHVAVLT